METGFIIGAAALVLICLGRSAVIAFFPGTGLAEWCEDRMGFIDTIGDSDGSDSDGGGDSGGD